MKKRLTIFTLAILGGTLLVPAKALAHCPLCTGGAGAAAAVAALLGVKYGAIAVFMGAFAAALGLWLPRLVKKQYVKGQSIILFWLVYLTTIIPLFPFLNGDYLVRYISITGEFGSWLNTTYLVDLFYVGAAAGTIIVYVAPYLSKFITKKRGGKTVRFQGLMITFLLLIATAVILQVVPRTW